jgi:subtilisin family serine protease
MVGFRPISLALLVLALLPGVAAASTQTQIIVKRDPGLSSAERADVRADADVRYVESLPLPRTEVVRAAKGDVADAIRDLNADPDVVYAERDRVVRAYSDDPAFPFLWGLENPGIRQFEGVQSVNDADMDVPDAWDMSIGAGSVVAVIDTGVDADHEDLGGRVLQGWDFVDDDPYADDLEGHGTHVAGTIAATRDNQIGVAGVAPETRILPIRVLDENGNGSLSDIIKGYDYAAERGVRLVNASLGGEGHSQAEEDAIEAAELLGVTFIVAAGNGGADGIGDDNDTGDPDYPCAYPTANIVCVGASRPDDKPAGFSNYGSTTVDVFAPGWDIVSTLPDDDYGFSHGTSMATPHVTGLAALLLARNPSLGPTHLRQTIVDSRNFNGDLNGLSVSDGRANADQALRLVDFDADNIADGLDNCPDVANPGQEDVDEDGVGDACPPALDPDGDAVPDDKCPNNAAPYAADGCPSADPTGDGDYWPDDLDDCLSEAGPINGCPDGDGDGVADWDDNCPTVPNANQLDSDGDGFGNACDSNRDGDNLPNTQDACPDLKAFGPDGCEPPPPPPPPPPPGNPGPTPPADADGDGVYDVSDGCRLIAARTRTGCPLPEVSSLSAKVRRRSATVRVKSTSPATIRITVQRKKGRRWVRVARKTFAGTRATYKVKRLKRGRHRVRISISSEAGRGSSRTKSFRVR